MKEILAKVLGIFKRFFCLFKLTISCRLGLSEKEEEQNKDSESEDSQKG